MHLQAYVALAERCWQQEPGQRPTFSEVAAQLRQMLCHVDQLQQEANRVQGRGAAVWTAQEGMRQHDC